MKIVNKVAAVDSKNKILIAKFQINNLVFVYLGTDCVNIIFEITISKLELGGSWNRVSESKISINKQMFGELYFVGQYRWLIKETSIKLVLRKS